MTRRKVTLTTLLTLAVLAAGLSGYWLWAAQSLQDAVARWAADQRKRGYEITFQGPEVTGFPVALKAAFGEPGVVTPRGWRWSGPMLSGEAKLWNPLTIDARLAGLHRFTRGGDKPVPAGELEAARADARVSLRRSGRVERATLDMEQIEFRNPATAPTTIETLMASLGPLRPASEDQLENLDFALRAKRLVLPEAIAGPLGSKVERLVLEGTLKGNISPGEARAALMQWRDAGGTLDLSRIELAWGPLELDADGTLSLDQEMRPLGALSARMRGLPETLDALARAGIIKPGQALAAKVALFALGAGQKQDGGPEVTLPITLQGGLLYLGPVPLLKVPPVL